MRKNDKDIAENVWKNSNCRKDNYFLSLYRDLEFKYKAPILDIGGGPGAFLNFIGVNDATILDVAGSKSLAGKYKFIEADITKKLPKLRNKFKTIFLMEVLEHIKNPLYLMAQVYDLLEDDGICYIAVPYTKLDIERKNQRAKVMCHVGRWKCKELQSQLSKLGFKSKVIQKRRRFKNTAFYLPHCWLVLVLKKRLNH